MITPILEKLIFEGKAQYKTFVAGCSNKHILNIPQNRYIIITDLWYTPSLYSDNPNTKINSYINRMITQLTILGTRGFNRFLFKNSIIFSFDTLNVENVETPNNPIHITTYLIHTDSLSFTFSIGENILAFTTSIPPNNVVALQPPSDYGKIGQPGVIATTNRSITPSAYEIDFQGQNLNIGTNGNNEFSYPVNAVTNLTNNLMTNQISYPILNVGYVEIQGQPENLGY